MLLVCNFLEMFLFIKLQELELQMEHFHLFCFWTNQNQTKPSHHHPQATLLASTKLAHYSGRMQEQWLV